VNASIAKSFRHIHILITNIADSDPFFIQKEYKESHDTKIIVTIDKRKPQIQEILNL